MDSRKVKYFMPTVSGAFNGMIQDNVKHLDRVNYSMNIPQMYFLKANLEKYVAMAKEKGTEDQDVKSGFLRFHPE